jgi:chromosome segregation ATPase
MSKSGVISKGTKQQVEVQARKDAVRLSKMAEGTIVTTAEEETSAYDHLKEIKTALKTIETKRTEITKPLNASLKTVNAMFKELSQPFKDADQTIRDKILEFREAEAEKAAKEQERRERIQASHEQRGHQTHDLEEVEPEVAAETVVTKRWTFDIVNLTKVPKEYFEFSPAKVRQAIRNGKRTIPGLDIYQESGLRV